MEKPRRQFVLPEGDRVYLDARGLPWETVIENGVRWVIVHDFPLMIGYNVTTARVALRLPPTYSDDQIDMAYFYPPLARADGRSINNLSPLQLDGTNWQQWSRHRAADNPWRPGVDGIPTHLALVEHWLEYELTR